MKTKILFLSAITLLLTACGGSSNDTTATSSTTTAAAPAPAAKTGGELLIAKSDCVGCHHKENKIIGPAYLAIAEKYPSNEENINLLAGKIINGGKGVWGTIPMTPHAKITEDDDETDGYLYLIAKKIKF